ncbi:MAG: hypothetical protein ACLR2E_22185 [Lachnospiraceae bacterium]
MGDGGNLQNKLCLWIEPFQLADGFGIGPDLDQVVDVVDVSIGKVIIFFRISAIFIGILLSNYLSVLYHELLGNKLPEHLKSGGIPPFFRVRP